MNAVLRTLLVGMPTEIIDDQGPAWRSGFVKRPVLGPVRLTREQLTGDGQEDRSVHGGPEKAMLVYCADHYPLWNAELGRDDLGDGAFGENLAVVGMDERTVAIGDVYRIGSAVIQVSQPRQPCWKLARRCRLPTMPAKAIATGRLGWYVRVLEPGEIRAGDHLDPSERPSPDWTIHRINRLYFAPKPADRAPLADLITRPGVSPEFIALVDKRLASLDP
jgi:MOSC domain-containing protein YiiM